MKILSWTRPLPSILILMSWCFKVFVNALLVNWAPWSVLKEDNTISVLFVEMGVELSLSRVHMAEAMFDVAKQRSTTQAWELTVSQPVTAEGEPCDAAGKPRYDQSMFSRFLSSWMYWTSKSRDYWVNQKMHMTLVGVYWIKGITVNISPVIICFFCL